MCISSIIIHYKIKRAVNPRNVFKFLFCQLLYIVPRIHNQRSFWDHCRVTSLLYKAISNCQPTTAKTKKQMVELVLGKIIIIHQTLKTAKFLASCSTKEIYMKILSERDRRTPTIQSLVSVSLVLRCQSLPLTNHFQVKQLCTIKQHYKKLNAVQWHWKFPLNDKI